MFAFMMALPQFFYNRAFYLRFRETLGQTAPQIVLDEETAANLHDHEPPARPLFQGRGDRGTTAAPAGGGHHLVSCRYEFNPPPGRAPAEP
jgi:hypothetical protein